MEDIKTLRGKYQFSVEELAAALGVSSRTVFRWEKGYEPSRLARREIRRFLDEIKATKNKADPQ